MSERRSPPIAADNGDNSDKPSAAGAGAAGISHDFHQNHTHRRPLPQPHELTAEWTVRAQLTFARAGEKVQREFSSNDPINPVRVVYKWSTFDTNTNPDDSNDNDESTCTPTTLLNKRSSASSSRGGKGSSCQSTPLKPSSKAAAHRHQQQHESFRSTTSSTNADYGGGDSAFSGSNASKIKRPTYKQQPQQQQQQTSTGPNGIGAATALYGTRCRSTCNIIVSAVADFLPPEAVAAAAAEAAATTSGTTTTDFIPEDEPDPFVFNTTACYTVSPEKSHDGSTTPGTPVASKNFTSLGKILALRDAFSQTSDTETKYFEEQGPSQRYSNSRSPIYRARSAYDDQQNRLLQQRKPYEQRHATAEALLQSTHHQMSPKQVDEGNSFMPSLTPSPPIQQTFKSVSMPRIPPLPGSRSFQSAHPPQHPTQKGKSAPGSGSGEQQKKPRTVHIDVYCTGSEDDEDDDQADAEASSSSDSEDEGGSKRHLDLESNSTPQTVFDNEQMLLRHKRITGQSQLPRRLTPAQQQQSHSSNSPQTLSSQSDVMNLGHAITKSSTAEEVSESKQLLFRKHVGDQRATKLATLRQKYIRQASDDALSSNYPNSSHSTVREATCSSISSVIASSQADCGDSSWKDTEELEDMTYSLAKSDSFEYENLQDRLRIHQMENLWSSSHGGTGSDGRPNTPAGRPGHMQATSFLHPITEGNSQRNSPFATPFQRNDTLPSESENFSPPDNDFLYAYPGRLGSVAHYKRQFQNISAQPAATSGTNRPGFLQFFGPQSPQRDSPLSHQPAAASAPVPQSPQPLTKHNLYPNYQPNLQRWKSETRDNLSANATPTPSPSDLCQRNSPQKPSTVTTAATIVAYSPSPQRCGSEVPPTTTTASTFQSPMVARRFEMHRDSPSVSEGSTVVSGYTSEYLEKARKFGKVVSTARKPGHHIGPTKNPNCSCESCARWMAERFQLRGRAFSVGERPVLKRPT